ncbi:MAG: hypothetical protein ABMA64_21955, partial [Myxococcota bacterium]
MAPPSGPVRPSCHRDETPGTAMNPAAPRWEPRWGPPTGAAAGSRGSTVDTPSPREAWNRSNGSDTGAAARGSTANNVTAASGTGCPPRVTSTSTETSSPGRRTEPPRGVTSTESRSGSGSTASRIRPRRAPDRSTRTADTHTFGRWAETTGISTTPGTTTTCDPSTPSRSTVTHATPGSPSIRIRAVSPTASASDSATSARSPDGGAGGTSAGTGATSTGPPTRTGARATALHRSPTASTDTSQSPSTASAGSCASSETPPHSSSAPSPTSTG